MMDPQAGGEPPAAEGSSKSAPTARKRTPGRWRRIPRAHPFTPSKTPEEAELSMLKTAEFIENMREEDCDLLTEEDRLDFHAFKRKMGPAMRLIAKSRLDNTFFSPIQFSDTKEEHLTAEDMEAQISARFPHRKPCQQAKDFAELALAHYNERNKTVSKQLIIFLPSQYLLLFF
ncbi:uncharacterized protein LOC125512741 [Triticum urartu]|uniref:uncharacterized protein LOC125512741 n=1 Tax=Triticum urartu TaxID=4572 RepID=UPI002044774F|nr:uncharacterized protein LOC125512741 [Triticum urartu]